MDLVVHPAVQAWTPTKPDLQKLLDFFGKKLPATSKVEVLPRSLANEALGKVLPKYTFRAFTRGDHSRVFADETETPESIAFLIAHELTHQLVKRSGTLRSAFEDASIRGIEHWTDRFHEVDAEERFCDGIAARILGTWYDRAWWRARTPPATYGRLPTRSPGRAPAVRQPRGAPFRFRSG